ncbi:MAG: PAS domain-containing sensor histidine kinase [Chlorobiota bacterium]|nr:MAG: PAS domain-containing sensor histidine kinase [Chlorobiota bacterium]
MNISAFPASLRKIYLLFGVLTMLTVLAGILFYLVSSSHVEEDIRIKLEKVSDAKKGEVEQWFEASIADGIELLNSMEMRGGLLKGLDQSEKLIFDETFTGWRKYLREDKGFVAIYLLDADLKKLDTLSGSSGEKVELKMLQKFKGTLKPVLSDFFSEKKEFTDHPYIYLLVPYIETGKKTPQRYLLVKIDPTANLLPRLWSATTLLGSQENRLVVNITTDPVYHWVLGSDGLKRRDLVDLRPTDLAYHIEKNDTGFISGKDYKQELSYAYLKSSPRFHFTLVAKISRDEILGPVRDVFWKTLSGVSLTLVILFISSRLMIKHEENEALKKAMESELEKEKNEKLLNAIIESSPDAIMLVEPAKGALTRFNKRAEEMFALNLAGPTVKIDPAKFHKKPVTDEEKALQQSTLAQNNIWRGDVEYISLDGREFWGNVVVTPIQSGKDRFFMVRITDITQERKILTDLQELTEELKRADEEKVKFMSVLAHDLRSPFHPLLNILDMLSSDYDTMNEGERKHFLESAGEIAGRYFEFLESLLNWSRASLGKISFNPKPVSPITVINETILLQEHLATEKGIKQTTRINTSDDVNADPEMLRTILRNLLVNAIKFTHSSGAVTVSAETEGENVVFSISDTGVGIPHDQISRLFTLDGSRSTPGTGNEQGTGLGLLLCKEFVNLHGGKIWVQSSPEKGSVFSFTMQVFKQ